MIESRRMKLAGHGSSSEKRNAYKLLLVKPEEERLLVRSRRRWVDNIKMGFTQPLIEISTRNRKIIFLGNKVWPMF
jgi:hypothetical protein